MLELPSRRPLGELQVTDASPSGIAVSRSGRHLFVAVRGTGGATGVRVLDAGTGREVQRLPIDRFWSPITIALSADGTRLAAVAKDDDVLLVFDVGIYP